ncbi:MAG: hypothetical protein CMJ74_08830 [Planctomycetaceae bacterium]|nr:hypothetical protein [Planctomycetaceae bacterium]|tara:strand:+ start:6230 stop:7993 length:1764 start_codon:yes stop_codon:yes gene_type:complete
MGWYYKIEEDQWGPVSVAQLLQLIHSGAIPPQGMVRQGEDSPWISVDQINAVLSSAGTLVPQERAPAAAVTAQQSATVSAPHPVEKVQQPKGRRKRRRRTPQSNAPHPMMVAIGTSLVLLVALLLVEQRVSNVPRATVVEEIAQSKPALPDIASQRGVDDQQASQANNVSDAGDSRLVERTDRSVVQIESSGGNGSGFIIDSSGTVVTNLHVVQNTGTAEVRFVDGSRYEVAGFVGLAEEKDLVLLRIRSNRNDFEPLPITTKLPRKGEKVYALGAPRGYLGSITDGIVSAIRSGAEIRDIAMQDGEAIDRLDGTLDFSEDITWIQTSSPISPGNSGGPLVNARGEVVGINTWIQTDAQNINFALSAENLQQLIDNRQGLQPLAMLPAGNEPSFVTHQRRQEEELRQSRVENNELEKRRQRLASASSSKRTARVVQELSHLRDMIQQCGKELRQYDIARSKILSDLERNRKSTKAVYLESENSAARQRQSRSQLNRLNKILLSKEKKVNFTDAEWAEKLTEKEKLIATMKHLQEHGQIIKRRQDKLYAEDQKLQELLKFNFVDWQTKKNELSDYEIRYVELLVEFPR